MLKLKYFVTFRWQDRLELEFYSEEFFKQPNLFIVTNLLKQNSESYRLIIK